MIYDNALAMVDYLTTEYEGTRPDAARCGTLGGYKRHRRNGQDACELCREAKRLDSAAKRGVA